MPIKFISRVRRNHGLEHASIHVLSEKHKNFSAQGNSDHRGFHLNIYGNISETEVSDAVYEAFKRMKNGEHQLAVHPNCGTVLLTTATMATTAALLPFGIEQKRRGDTKLDWMTLANVLPTAILAVVATLIISRPIGVQLQAKYTVEGNLRDMVLISVRKINPSPVTRFFQFLLTAGRGSKLKATAYKIETMN